jgi:hypothetical protein
MPHSAYQRSGSLYQLRKQLTRLGSRFVNRAQVALEKDTSILITLQDTALVRSFNRVLAYELMELESKKAAQMLNVAVSDLRSCDPAAIRARGTVDCVLHSLRNCFEPPLHEIMPSQPGAESRVLFSILFPVALNLYEVS